MFSSEAPPRTPTRQARRCATVDVPCLQNVRNGTLLYERLIVTVKSRAASLEANSEFSGGEDASVGGDFRDA